MAELTHEIRGRVERLLRDRIVAVEPVSGGYTAAGRWRLVLASGGTAFVKFGTTDHTREALRLERSVYDRLQASFMPRVVAWEEHALQPLLVLEDLSSAVWPPPWNGDLVEAVRVTLDRLHASQVALKSFGEVHPGLGDGWQRVHANPEHFQSLGLTTASWLKRALPALIAASTEVQTSGEEVLHLDVRSDNICQTQRGVVLVDWNWACLGNGALDTGFWLPSLEAEGGPPPDQTLPSRPDIAAYVSGFFAARAGLPPIPEAPHVRRVQLQQLLPALSWAARELRLPQPGSTA
jgi:hypothetical protein